MAAGIRIDDKYGGMSLVKKNLFNVTLLIFFIGSYTGCAHIVPPPQEHSQARQILNQLADNNSGLTQFKALAHVRLESDSQIVSGRIALAAVVPDKIRIEWLNMMGQPLNSLSGDGEVITVISRSDNKVHRFRQSATAMEPLIHIPIGAEDLQKIVIGRLPLPVDAAVQLKESDSQMDMLVLKDRWHNVVATLKVDRISGRAIAMQAFNAQGKFQYEIRWLQWRKEGVYVLPVKIAFESESRQRLVLTIDRFWPDADVPGSIFKLDTP